MFAEPRVTLVALTQLATKPDGFGFAAEEWLSLDVDSVESDDGFFDSDFVGEFAGRGCYEAWSRSNPATATSATYHEHIQDVGHESIYGHASATFYVTGVSRSLTHELVRHRFQVFSQRSQRFVDEADCEFVLPPLLADLPDALSSARDLLEQSLLQSRQAYRVIVESLLIRGIPRKQAREAARAVLPEATETRLTVTGNVRAWRDFVRLRNTPEADAEIRRFAQLVLTELRTRVAPASVQDL